MCFIYGCVGNFKNFYCFDGSYNDLVGFFFNINEDSVRNLFSKGINGEF